MLKVVTLGISEYALDILNNSMPTIFGNILTEDITSKDLSYIESYLHSNVKNLEIVLWVIGLEYAEKFSESNQDLFSSHKCLTYVSDKEFVLDLNEMYSLDLPLPDEVVEEASQELENEVKELKEKVKTLEGVIEEKEFQKKQLERQIEDIRKSKDEELDELVEELNNVKKSVVSTPSNGVSDLDLFKKERELADISSQLGGYKLEVERLKTTISEKNAEISDLKAEIRSYRVVGVGQVGMYGQMHQVQQPMMYSQEDVSKIKDENSELKRKLSILEKELRTEKEKIKSNSDLYGELEKANEKLKVQDKDLTILNQKIADYESQRDSLREQINKYSGVEEENKRLLKMLDNNIAKLANGLEIDTANKLTIYKNSLNQDLKNIRFVYAGSNGSIKGSYKCLEAELKNSSKKYSYVILDLCHETSIDYYFLSSAQKLKNGTDWLLNGGNIRDYLSPTKYNNIAVLSLGIKYINSLALLNVDWEHRLLELSKCGHYVYIFVGSLSETEVRIMYNSFSKYTGSVIFVNGDSAGSRSVYLNLMGTSHSSDVIYFNFNPKYKVYKDWVSKTSTTRIITL